MSTLIRDDHSEFVLQPYRELITYRTANITAKEIRFLAQQNGQYARLFKQADGRYEAVFSPNTGYLLAESIWRYFNEPAELIYVEELPDHESAIVIIVHNSTILFDAKLPLSSVSDELSSLLSLNSKFNIYIYGNVPVTQVDEANKVVFDDEHVLSFTRLQTSAFNEIENNSKLLLLPIEQAIAEQHFDRTKIWVSTVCTVIAFLFVFGYFGFAKNFTVAQSARNPFQGFQLALRSPSPTLELTNLSQALVSLYSLPGWDATAVNYTAGDATVSVHSLGGTLMQLMRWANIQGAQVILTTTGAELNIPTQVVARPAPTTITPITPTAGEIIDDMMQLFPGKSVSVENISSQGVYKTMDINISFHEITPSILDLLGKKLAGLPVKLDSVTTAFDNGLLDGSVKLTVLGN